MSHNSLAPTTAGRPWLRGLSWAVSLLVLGAMVWLLHRYLSAMRWADVAAAWSRLPGWRVSCSLLASAVSLCMLALFDVLAARVVVGRQVSVWTAGFAGLLTQALSNTLGFQAVTGGAVRYRVYRAAGVEAGDIARIVALAGMGVAMGFVVVITAAFCWEPQVTRGWGRWPGLALAAGLVLMLRWLAQRPRQLRLGHWTLIFPPARIVTAQMLVGTIEMVAAIAALYVLLPSSIAPAFIDFLPIYVGAVVAGLISNAPGGAGVFETILLASFPAAARAEVLAALLCYRLSYNLVPFTLGTAMLVLFELRQRLTTGRHRSQGDQAGAELTTRSRQS